MSTLLQDLRYAARSFGKTPGFTAVVVLSIGLGIAANTTVFSIVNGLMLATANVGDPASLVAFNDGNTISWPNYVDYRDQTTGKVFEGLSGFFPLVPANIGGYGTPERVWGQMVTANYFDVLRVKPVVGRGFVAGEDQGDGAHPLVVLGHSLWQRRFGADRAIAGRPVMLNGRQYTVIGVAPEGFSGSIRMMTGEFWAPICMASHLMPELTKGKLIESRDAQWLMINGRLKRGVSRPEATAVVNVVKSRIDATYYKGDQNRANQKIRLTDSGRLPEMGNATALMVVLMSVVGLVLLIACANVANLMLARAAARRKEIGIRLSIGAGRGRIIRQLLTESVFLALAGSVFGFALAWIATEALSKFELPIPFPVAFNFRPDMRVLAFTIGVSILSGIVFGLAPALRSVKADVFSGMKDQGTGSSGSRRFGLRNALVMVQVALSLVLLIASGLFVRSLRNASTIDLGMKTSNVLMVGFDPKLNNYAPERNRQFIRTLREQVENIPGIQSVSFVDSVPLSIGGVNFDFEYADAKEKRTANADIYRVGRRFFNTLGIQIVRGRDFTTADGDDVAILNQKMAERLFGAQDALGQTITSEKKPYRVIGISRTAKSRTLGEDPANCAYLSLEANPDAVMSFFGVSIIAKTATAASGQYERAIRDRIQALDPNLAIISAETMQSHVDKALLLPKACATLLGVFGLVGLALAAVGLYGVLSFAVRSRTREIGIRMALGASAPGVLRMVAGQGLAVASAGLAVGIAIAWAVTRFVESFLYGIGAHDLATFVAVPLVLLAVALISIVAPARRAARIEPMIALRYE